MMTVLLAAGSPVTMLVFSVVICAVSVLMIYMGRQMIKTKSARAVKLERLWADQEGKIHGGMAVMKGYIALIGGVVMLLMSIVMFLLGIYVLIFGPINLN